MVTCAAINCGNTSTKKKISDVQGWHPVPPPESPVLRKNWIIAMKGEPPYPKDEHFVLRGKHFHHDDFERDLRGEVMPSAKKIFKLKENPVPSIFTFTKKKRIRESSAKRAEKRRKPLLQSLYWSQLTRPIL